MDGPPGKDTSEASALPSTADNGPKTILVIGSSPDWIRVREEVPHADLVISYDLMTALRLNEDLGGRECRVVDIYSRTKELEDEAWEWANSLTAAASTRLPAFAPRFRLMRRSCFAGPLLDIATARARASEVAALATKECHVLLNGVTPVERIALGEFFEIASRPGVAHETANRGEPPKSSGSKLDVLVRVMRDESSGLRRLRKARAAVRRVRKDTDRPVIAVHVGVPAHLRVLQPALDELAARGWSTIVVDMSRQSLISHEPTVQFWSLYRREGIARLALRRILGPTVSRVVSGWTQSNGLGAYVTGVRDWFVSYCFFEIPGLLGAHRHLHKVLGQGLSLTTNETVPEIESCVPISRAAGIATVNVQHGVITATKRRAEFDFDAFCVFGEEYARILEQNGTPGRSIRVVGNPLLDSPAIAEKEPEIRREHGIPADRFLITFAAQYAGVGVTDWVLYRSLSVVLEAVSTREDLHLLLKWHPAGSGREEAYQAALREHPIENMTSTRSSDLYRLISASDCVAVLSSTVGFEAAALRTPVIAVNPVDPPFGSPFVQAGTALNASDPEEFIDRVDWLRSGGVIPESRFEDLDLSYHYRRDGKAGARIADICEGLVEAK